MGRASSLDNLLMYDGKKNLYNQLGTGQPRFSKNMRKFGEIGIVLD